MDNNRVWVYCRVAYPDMDALELQKMHLINYAREHGFSIVGVTAEQKSGLDYSRTGLREVLVAAEDDEIDFVLVKDLSRLGRDVVKTNGCLHWLKARGVDVICADGTSMQPCEAIMTKLMEASGV